MNEIKRSIFSGMQILNAQKWVSGYALVIENDAIKGIIPDEMIKHHIPAKRYEFSREHYLIPGLIDLHVHGINGHDVMDANKTSLQKISKALAEQGVTSFLATTMTTDNEHLVSVINNIVNTMPELEGKGAAILGIHLEGPFIAKEKIGAQQASLTQAPNLHLMHHWQHIAKGVIKLVTLAPELPGAIQLIKALVDSDVIASIGHTNATYEETCAAIAAGAKHATHLFNAMRSIHQREPGATGALLLAEEVMAELIVDGKHVHPVMVKLALNLKGKKQLALVTDAMRATCLGDGTYDLGGQTVYVTDGKVTLADGTLAGSTLRLPQAVKNMAQFTNCSLIDAISMATENPAHALKILDRKGTIEVGKDADVVVLNNNLEVLLTMVSGKEVWCK